MTITQTVTIPADRRLQLEVEVPLEIPAGRAQVKLKVISFVKKQEKPTTKKNADSQATPHTDALLNILSGLGEINLEEIRDERLARQL